MSHTDTRSVGELEAQIGALDDASPSDLTADERARLTDALVALADAYGDRGDFHAEANALSSLERLHTAHPGAEIDVHLATALANATAVRDRDDVYETSIQPDRIGEYRDRIEALYDDRRVPAIAAPLARATAETIHANAKAGRLDRVGPLCERLEATYEAHSDPDVAASLLTGYAHAERHLETGDAEQTAGDNDPIDRLERAETLFERHPDADVAAGYAGVLAGRTNRDADRGAVEAIEGRIARIEALAQGYPASEAAIRGWIPMATANATRAGFEAADVSRVDHWARQTVEHHEAIGTPTSATWLAVATFFAGRAAFFDGDVETGEARLDRLSDLADTYENPVFNTRLGRRIRASGENPRALDTAGVSVSRTRYVGVLLSGVLCGIGGAGFTLGQLGRFVGAGQTSIDGRGFLGIVAYLFGNYNPITSLGGALLFASLDSLQLRLQQISELDVPSALFGVLPFIVVIVVLTLIGGTRLPAALGQHYDDEE